MEWLLENWISAAPLADSSTWLRIDVPLWASCLFYLVNTVMAMGAVVMIPLVVFTEWCSSYWQYWTSHHIGVKCIPLPRSKSTINQAKEMPIVSFSSGGIISATLSLGIAVFRLRLRTLQCSCWLMRRMGCWRMLWAFFWKFAFLEISWSRLWMCFSCALPVMRLLSTMLSSRTR